MKYFLKHPLKTLKNYLPKSMFGRSLLILVLPLLLIQIVASYVFLDSYWDRVTKTIARNIAGEVATVLALYNETPENEDFYQSLAGAHLKLRVAFTPTKAKLAPTPASLQSTALDSALKEQIFTPVRFTIKKREIFIDTAAKEGILRFITPLSRFCSKSVSLFIMWVSVMSAIFLLIAVAFLHNQVKPLRRLAIAADRFGKGRSFSPLKPEGAIEIRKLTQAFTNMRDRLHKQLTQRTEMLAGVSHDLRTPLTRMSLQLAMMPSSPETKELQKDIAEMNKMLEGYLTFARGEGPEEAIETDISLLLQNAILGRADLKKTVQYTPTPLPPLLVKPHALKRCLTNLINNGTRYGKQVWVDAHVDQDTLIILIEDNGPGIPKNQREDVFKPFFRLDSSRNTATGGVGLGLSIAQDIAHSHGGKIVLDSSEHGGLKASLILPY